MNRLAALGLAGVLAAGTLATSVADADAQSRRWNRSNAAAGAALLALPLIAGAAIASASQPRYYYDGYYDGYGYGYYPEPYPYPGYGYGYAPAYREPPRDPFSRSPDPSNPNAPPPNQ